MSICRFVFLDRPKNDWTFDNTEETAKLRRITEKLNNQDCPNVQLFLATHWTLEWCLFNSNALSDIFMDSCRKIHRNTEEFRKGDDGMYDKIKFRDKLATKLKNRSLDKVAVASEISLAINSATSPLDIRNEDTAFYLINAINHACK